MIEVAIFINGEMTGSISARRLSPVVTKENPEIPPDTICTYGVSDGGEITHRYGDGSVALAKILLSRMPPRK